MNEFNAGGNIDIGSSMQTAFKVMSECLTDINGYELDLEDKFRYLFYSK